MSMTSPQAKAPAPAMEFQPVADYGLLADCNSAALVVARRVGRLAVPAALRQPGDVRAHPRPGRAATGRSGPPATTRASAATCPARSCSRPPSRPTRGPSGWSTRWRSPRASAVTTSARRAARAAAPRRRCGGHGRARARARPPRPSTASCGRCSAQADDGGRTFGGPNQIAVSAGVPVEVADVDDARPLRRVRGRAGRVRPALGRGREPRARAMFARTRGRADRGHRRGLALVGGRARHLRRGRTASSCASARACSRASPTARPARSSPPPTTSLPETVGGERNWDYRYAWIRDASLTLEALYIGACSDEAEDFVSFMTSSAGGRVEARARCRSCTGSAASTTSPSASCRTCRGWRDSRPVRVGNGAWDQTQLDVYGELLNALWLYREQLGELHPEIQQFVAELADAAAAGWQRDATPACGRCAASRGTTSPRRSCAGPRSTARSSSRPQLGEHAKVDEWAAERDRDPRGRARARLEREAPGLRAGVRLRRARRGALLMPLLGFLPATDERMRSTIDAIADDLTEDGLVLRYRNEEGLNADGLDGRGGHVRDLLVLARVVRSPRPARSTARKRSSTSSPATPTTSACWPRRSTPRTTSCSATSRRRSATSG